MALTIRLTFILQCLLMHLNAHSQKITTVYGYQNNLYLVYPGNVFKKVDSTGLVIAVSLDTAKNNVFYIRQHQDTVTNLSQSELLRYQVSTGRLDTLFQYMGAYFHKYEYPENDILVVLAHRDFGYFSQDIYLINRTTLVTKYLPSCAWPEFKKFENTIEITEITPDLEKPGYSVFKTNAYSATNFKLLKTVNIESNKNQ